MEFTERMEAGRDAAAHRRHRGLTTGKAAEGWDVQRSFDGEDTWHGALYVVRTRWEIARDEALAVYASAMFPERFADLPF